MRGLRVLLVTARYLPELGGTEIHTHEIARRFAAEGLDVTVLTTTLQRGQRVSGTDDRAESRDTHQLPHVVRVRAWPAKRDYYFAPAIFNIIARGNWDVVHIHSYHTLVPPLAMLAALRGGHPYLLTFHGGGHSSHMRQAFRGPQMALLRPLLVRADRLIVNSQFEASFYAERLARPASEFVIVPNGSDLPRRPSADARSATDRSLIASIGRLERYKGHHRVIEALPYVLEQRPDIRLWVAGSGPYEQQLLSLARDLGVEEHVEIRAIPAHDREKMADELSRPALIVLLSEFESHCMTVLEAAGLGLSVLVADQTGLAELAREGLARAIPLSSTPREVARAILHQLDHPHLPTAGKIPTWDDVASSLLALYRDVLQERAGAP